MTPAPATLAELLPRLAEFTPETPVIFATPEGEIGPGYHLTELKLAQINSIDCGGTLNSWSETQLQLLDGADGEHMKVGKLAAILQKSVVTIDGLATAPLWLELALGNQGLARFFIASASLEDARIVVTLRPDHAQCKPMTAGGCGPQSTQSCCG